jgi:multiple sugar transport system substrate-binding protein
MKRLSRASVRLRVVVALMLVAALGAVSGCAKASSGSSKTLNFMVAEYSPKTAPFWKQTIADFEKANPGLTVNLQVVGWQQMHDTIAQRISANTMPDLVNTATIWLPEWVKAGAIQPVSTAVVPSSVQDSILPVLLQKGAQYNGKNWGLPIAAAARAMFYNKDLFTKAGLDPNKPPSTWDQMLSDAQQIKAKTGSFGYAFDGKGVQAFRYFGYFLWNNGGDFFDSSGKAAFNSPQGVQALDFLVKLVKSGSTPDPTAMTVADIEPLVNAGKVGSFIDGNYFTAQIASQGHGMTYGVGQVPVSGPSVTPVTWGVTDTLAIGKKADAALVSKFISYIYQPSVRTTFDTNEGLLPLLTSQQHDTAFSDPATQEFIKLLGSARFDPLNPNYSKMQTLLTTAIQQAVKGSQGPAAALDAAAKSFNSLAQ